MEPTFKFSREDLLKVIAKFCADNLSEKLDPDLHALDIRYNEDNEIEVYLVNLENLH